MFIKKLDTATIPVYFPPLVLFLLTLSMAYMTGRAESQKIELEFSRQADMRIRSVINEFELNIEALYAIRAFYDSSVFVDRDEFSQFASLLIQRHNGVQALEWVPRVSAVKRPEFERALIDYGLESAHGQSGFKRWTLEKGWHRQTTDWAEYYFPVFYVEPYQGNEAALGIDLASSPTRAPSINQALTSGKLSMTPPIDLAQGVNGILAFLPVYSKITDTNASAEPQVLGLATGVFVIGSIVQSALEKFSDTAMSIQFMDISDDDGYNTLYDNSIVIVTDSLSHKVPYAVGGRRYLIKVQAGENYLAGKTPWGSYMILISGSFIAFMLFLMLWIIRTRARTIEQTVEMRTRELSASNQKLRETTENLEMVTQELESRNEELNQFASMASHDLQSPLRGVTGFAQILREDVGDRLDEESLELLDGIVTGGKRMHTLINDLLNYSRLESTGKNFTACDMNRVYDDACQLLQSIIEEAQAVVTRDELPTVLGDASQLSQLLHNLIGNGIKYQPVGQVAKIHVSAQVSDQICTFRIADNGIGIAPEHQKQVFDAFRRLHTEREYSGTGIGLAICKRVVDRHNGRIWLESEPGQGTRFYFTLPLFSETEQH